MNKNVAVNPNLPMGERAQGAVGAIGNKISETTHEVKKAYHQTQAGLTSDVVTGQGKKEYPGESNIQHAGNAAIEHAREIDQRAQFEINKNIAVNPNLPMGERAQGAVGAVGNKVSETTHEVKKAYHQTQAGLTSDVVTGQGLKEYPGESSIKHAGNAAIEHAQEIDQKAQFEMNKNIAINPNLPMGERAQGAVDAFGNKISETTHEVKKAYHQTQAGLTSEVVTGQGLKEYPSGVVSGQGLREYPSTTVSSNIKLAGIAATEHSQEVDQKLQFEMHKNIAMNPDIPAGERAQGAVEAVGNKMSEKAHEASKVVHQGLSGLTTSISTPFTTDLNTQEHRVDIKQAGIAAKEHSLEIDQKARFEAHKNVVMNPDIPVGERAQAAVEAVGNLMSEKAHEANKAIHQTLSGLAPEVLTAEGQREQNPTIKHAGIAATEHALEMDQKAQYELHKNIVVNSNKPAGERTQAAVEAVGNLVSEKAHEVNKAYHQAQAGLTDIKTGEGHRESTTTEKPTIIKHAGLAATEHALEIDQKQQFELNKNIALNEDLTIGERTQAALGAVGNKVSELTHEVSKKYHQNLAGVSSEVKTAYAPNTFGLSYESETHDKPVPKRDIKQAGWAAKEHALEIDQKVRFEAHKNVAVNPDMPVGERAQAAVEAVGNLMSEKAHGASKVYYQTLSGLGTEDRTLPDRPEDQTIPIDKIKHAGIAALEHAQEINQKAEFEAKKNIVLNPEIPIVDRAQAALEAVGSKISAVTHETSKAYHQSLAGVVPEVTEDVPIATEIKEQKSIKLEKIKHVGLAATEHSQEINQKEQFEANKNVVLNPNVPTGERAQAALGAIGSLISEKIHESNKIYHQNLAGLKSETDLEEPKPTPSTKILHAGLAAAEHAQEIDQKEQFEINKRLSNNPDIPAVERAQAALEAVGNKISEKAHETTKVYHQGLSGLATNISEVVE